MCGDLLAFYTHVIFLLECAAIVIVGVIIIMMILRISECFYSLEAVINTNKNGMLHLFRGFKKCVIERSIYEIFFNI